MRVKNIFQSNYTEWNWRKPLPIIASPLVPNESHEKTNGDKDRASNDSSSALSVHPILKKSRQPSSMELLFDLFFVGALATFNSSQGLTTWSSIGTYIFFMIVLWFSWFQATIFDVRFYADSITGRLFKLIHIALMTGYAIFAAKLNVDGYSDQRIVLRHMSFLLMSSRSAFIAKLITIATLFAAAVAFLGFSLTTEYVPQWACYFVIAIETVIMIVISSFWETLSFKGTPLVERFVGLTLIVLGEGIVGMTDSIKTIAVQTSLLTKTSLSLITCHTLLICFVYALYKDIIDEQRFGYIRQQIWAILHFPLHLTILITSKGSRTWILYGVAWNILTDTFVHLPIDIKNSATSAEVVDHFKKALGSLSSQFLKGGKLPDFTPIYEKMLAFKDAKTLAESDVFRSLTMRVSVWTMHSFSIAVPIEEETGSWMLENYSIPSEFERIVVAMNIIFVSYFTAAGLTLIFLALQHWFSKSHKSRAEVLSIVITTTFGVLLSLISLFSVFDRFGASDSPLGDYINSSWPSPTIILCYFVVIVIDNSIIWGSNVRRSKKEALDAKKITGSC